MTEELLRVGDYVMWRGNFGNNEPRKARVKHIEYCRRNAKHGKEVPEILWGQVKEHAIVDLQNGYWAYGYQIEQIKEIKNDKTRQGKLSVKRHRIAQ